MKEVDYSPFKRFRGKQIEGLGDHTAVKNGYTAHYIERVLLIYHTRAQVKLTLNFDF